MVQIFVDFTGFDLMPYIQGKNSENVSLKCLFAASMTTIRKRLTNTFQITSLQFLSAVCWSWRKSLMHEVLDLNCHILVQL